MSAVMVEHSVSTAALLSTSSFDGGKQHHHTSPSSSVEGQPSLGSTAPEETAAAKAARPSSPAAPEKSSSEEVITRVGSEQSPCELGNGHVTLPSDCASEDGDANAGISTTDDSLTVKGMLSRKASTDDTFAGGVTSPAIDQVYFCSATDFCQIVKDLTVSGFVAAF